MNRAKLEEQIGEMEYQLHRMREELNKPKKFEWSYDKGNTFYIRMVSISDGYDGIEKEFLEHGRYRKTKQSA